MLLATIAMRIADAPYRAILELRDRPDLCGGDASPRWLPTPSPCPDLARLGPARLHLGVPLIEAMLTRYARCEFFSP